jgi:hypothetical protein
MATDGSRGACVAGDGDGEAVRVDRPSR